MKFKKDKLKIGILVVLFLIIIFVGYNYLQNREIKQANINGYAFLEQISQCDIIYNIDITSWAATPELEKECLEDAAKNLKIDLKEIYELSRKYRESIKGYTHLRDYYIDLINKLSEKESKDELMKSLTKKEQKPKKKDFSINTKSKIFIKEAIDNP